MTCKNHVNRIAARLCSQCRLPICDECTIVRGPRYLCPEDAKVDNTVDEEDRIEHLVVADPAIALHAGFGSRLSSLLIDAIVVIIASVLLAAAFWLFTGVPPIAIRVLQRRPVEFVFYWALIVLFIAAYSIVFTITEGQTLGKQAMRMTVVQQDGTTPTLQTAVGRFFGSIISVSCLLLGFFVILIDPQRRAWHDRWSNTYVVSLDEATERL